MGGRVIRIEVFALLTAVVPTVVCSGASRAGLALEEVPVRHRPAVVQGRDFWHGFSKYSVSDRQPTLNPELEAHPAIADAYHVYIGRAQPPPDESGHSLWPKLADNFTSDTADREILDGNPNPDRPFLLIRRCERNRTTWGSPVTLDRADYAAWRAKHPNLLVDGTISEWCNDLNNAWRLLEGYKPNYGDERPNSSRRMDCYRAFLGEKPKDRYEYVEKLRRYYEMRKERNYGGTIAVLDAHLNSLHVAGDFGARLLRLETSASGHYRYQPSAMFTRGAARQFGVPWEWYVAGYMNGPSKRYPGDFLGDAMCRYPQTPKASGKPAYASATVSKSGRRSRIGCGGPDFGISRSLFRRTHYLAYLSGATLTCLEEWYSVVKTWNKEAGKAVFSPRGRIYAEFVDFTRAHPDRGAPYAPVAVCVPIAQGYPTWGGSPWARDDFGYTAGDRAVDAVVYTLYPGKPYGETLKSGCEQNLVNSPFANMYDVISPDAKSQTPEQLLAVMKSYKALVVVGDYPDRGWEKTLARFESDGGRVVRVTPKLLADRTGAGEISGGAVRFPALEAELGKLQDAYFPFRVEGDCAYGLTVADDHVWLYVFNNDGVTKFADAPEELDTSKATDVTVSLRPGRGSLRKVTELLSGKDVAVLRGTSFGCRLGPGELAIFEIR